MRATPVRIGPFTPLKLPVFRMLWFTWLAANTTMWMNDVAAAWLMTSIAHLAAVGGAGAVGLHPAGVLPRAAQRRAGRHPGPSPLLHGDAVLGGGVAIVLCGGSWPTMMTAPLLLALTFANGIGLAMRWPVFAAIVPEVVPRPQLAQALGPQRHRDERLAHHRPAAGRGAHRQRGQRLRLRAQRGAVAVARASPCMRWRREHHESPLGREKPHQRDARGRAVRAPVAAACAASSCASRSSSCTPPPSSRCCRCWRVGCEGGAAGTFTHPAGGHGLGRHRRGAEHAAHPRQGRAAQLVLRGMRLQALGRLGVAYAPNTCGWRCRPCSSRRRLDLGGQLAHGRGPDGAARLGAGARHVDLPDLHHGRDRLRRGASGARSPRSAQRARQPLDRAVTGVFLMIDGAAALAMADAAPTRT
jgi:hypothetical protein